MTKRRHTPRISLTLDADVIEWIQREAAAHRISVSRVVTRLLAEAKDRAEGKAVRGSQAGAEGRKAA